MPLRISDKYLEKFIAPHEYDFVAPQAERAFSLLMEKKGPGSDFLGWIDLPETYDQEEFSRIESAAEKIQKDSKVLLVIGIGGSYLGPRAVIELLNSPFYNDYATDTPKVFFVGNDISPTHLKNVLRAIQGVDFSINVISKSGTTTEPALAFRIFREELIKRYGKEGAKSRIYCTTDQHKGTLKELADREGYSCFVIPDTVGGRFTVLTAVGLLPIAASGISIRDLMAGAKAARHDLASFSMENPAVRYAAIRNLLYRKGKSAEMLVAYDPSFLMMAEWYKQLFGESEGKDGKGLFPASVNFSTDLHSMGQFIQEGSPILFETVIHYENPQNDQRIASDPDNFDGLNFLAGKTVGEVNEKAFQGTLLAHVDGGVPNVVIHVPENTAFETGFLLYFFELSCGISGYLLGVNPFDQPGVEKYKKNMFALLGKPGYEEEQARLLNRLS